MRLSILLKFSSMQTPVSSSSQVIPAKPRQPTDWRYQVQQYGAAAVVAGIVFGIFSLYLYYRRGYYDLYIINKIFAGDAAILLGLVLLLGPLTRMFDRFDKYLQYRKELGVSAFILALLHSISSFFFLGDHFPWSSFFGKQLYPFLFGLGGIIVLSALFISSRMRVKELLGTQAWWKFQYWGVRVAFLLTALHVGVMKWKGWVVWYQQGGGSELMHPEWPGAGLLVGWFMAFVVFVRIIERLDKQWGKTAWYVTAILFPAIVIGTFIWGQQFSR